MQITTNNRLVNYVFARMDRLRERLVKIKNNFTPYAFFRENFMARELPQHRQRILYDTIIASRQGSYMGMRHFTHLFNCISNKQLYNLHPSIFPFIQSQDEFYRTKLTRIMDLEIFETKKFDCEGQIHEKLAHELFLDFYLELSSNSEMYFLFDANLAKEKIQQIEEHYKFDGLVKILLYKLLSRIPKLSVDEILEISTDSIDPQENQYCKEFLDSFRIYKSIAILQVFLSNIDKFYNLKKVRYPGDICEQMRQSWLNEYVRSNARDFTSRVDLLLAQEGQWPKRQALVELKMIQQNNKDEFMRREKKNMNSCAIDLLMALRKMSTQFYEEKYLQIFRKYLLLFNEANPQYFLANETNLHRFQSYRKPTEISDYLDDKLKLFWDFDKKRIILKKQYLSIERYEYTKRNIQRNIHTRSRILELKVNHQRRNGNIVFITDWGRLTRHENQPPFTSRVNQELPETSSSEDDQITFERFALLNLNQIEQILQFRMPAIQLERQSITNLTTHIPTENEIIFIAMTGIFDELDIIGIQNQSRRLLNGHGKVNVRININENQISMNGQSEEQSMDVEDYDNNYYYQDLFDTKVIVNYLSHLCYERKITLDPNFDWQSCLKEFIKAESFMLRREIYELDERVYIPPTKENYIKMQQQERRYARFAIKNRIKLIYTALEGNEDENPMTQEDLP